MKLNEGTARTLIRALARGDLEAIELAVMAVTKEESYEASWAGEEMYPRQRQLLAWRYGLPPYHRNLARRDVIERRVREKRLVGCFTELVLREKEEDEEDKNDIVGKIVDDDGESWTIEVKQKSLAGSGATVRVPVRVPLDGIRACLLKVNDAQLAARPDIADEHAYLGLPPWLRKSDEAGLFMSKGE